LPDVERVLFAPRELPPLPPDVSHDQVVYPSWVSLREEARRRSAPKNHHPLALYMITEGEPTVMLEQTLRSISHQTSRAWTLTIVAVSDRRVNEVVRTSVPRRLRRRVRSLAGPPGVPARDLVRDVLASNQGHAVALIFPGDVWAPDAVATLGTAVSPDSVVYADEDVLSADGTYRAPRFKPEYSPDFLVSSSYIGRPMAMGSEVVRRLPPFVADDTIALEHECVLAACEIAESVSHVAEVLCHRSEPVATPAVPAGIAHVEAALGRRGERGNVVAGLVPGTFQIVRPATSARISILVPFRDEPRFLRTCVDSVTATTRAHDVELLLIDNGSTDPEVLTLLDRFDARDDVRVLSDPRPFNWALLNNEGAKAARGEVLVFLNNDIEAQSDEWLTFLVGHAVRPDVGAVGARLIYPDGRLQHCGVVVGLIGAAGHPLLGLAHGQPGYLDMALATRECSAVTGACFASRREVFELLNGFDETLGVDLNDVDFCLRAAAAGYRTLYEPAAELIHHESPSRGTAGGVEDIVNFIERWTDYISTGDPYFSPHLTRSSVSCGLAGPEEEGRWKHWHSTLVTR
jgi:GT2 family glycosyltransferase